MVKKIARCALLVAACCVWASRAEARRTTCDEINAFYCGESLAECEAICDTWQLGYCGMASFYCDPFLEGGCDHDCWCYICP
jgi:hypothetical protein